jgi:hypothetical protein
MLFCRHGPNLCIYCRIKGRYNVEQGIWRRKSVLNRIEQDSPERQDVEQDFLRANPPLWAVRLPPLKKIMKQAKLFLPKLSNRIIGTNVIDNHGKGV